MAKELLELSLTTQEQELLLRAVGEHKKTVAALATKVEQQGYASAAKDIADNLKVLRDLEDKLL